MKNLVSLGKLKVYQAKKVIKKNDLFLRKNLIIEFLAIKTNLMIEKTNCIKVLVNICMSCLKNVKRGDLTENKAEYFYGSK